MTGKSCKICGQPIRNIDFYLATGDGIVCPFCMLTQRSVRSRERQRTDQPVDYSAMAANQMSAERQLFF